MTAAEMNRRLATMTADQLHLARRMIKEGYGSRDIAAETDITVKQANAVAEWMDRYPSIVPTARAAVAELIEAASGALRNKPFARSPAGQRLSAALARVGGAA